MTFEPPSFPLQGHLGMTLDVPEPGSAVARVAVTEALKNPNGVLHGAVLFALVDTAMGAATMSLLDEGLICASIEVHLRFIRAVSEGEVTAKVSVVHPGSRVVQLQAEVHDNSERLIATATGSFAVLAPRPG